MPTVRSSVLLPDMFEPLTTRSCVAADETDVVAHHGGCAAAADGPAACPRTARVTRVAGSGETISGNGSPACSYRYAGQRAQRLELRDGLDPHPNLRRRAAGASDRPQARRAA